MTVLVLASEQDPSADVMVKRLRDLTVPVLRLDTAWFPRDVSIDASLKGGRWVGRLDAYHRRVDLEEIRSVWYRSPRAFRFPEALTDAEAGHAFVEAKYGFGGVIASLPALWINHPFRIASAAYKPHQLTVASSSGLSTPDTIVTNVPDSARAVVEGGPTVAKLFGGVPVDEGGATKLGFTRRLDLVDVADMEGVRHTAHLFQSWVPKNYEARVLVTGGELTAVGIHAHSDAGREDWRRDYDSLTYDTVDVPEDVVHGVRVLMYRLGLVYGALDFIVTPDGEWVFLEVNPSGQFGWLEAAAGVDVTGRLASLLAEGRTA